MKKILITGGAGFIGSHLAEKLLNEGNEVICLDNYFTGREENIAHLKSNPNFKAVTHDIVNPYFVEADRIYNLACPASPVHYGADPIKTAKTSVFGILNMLETAQKCGARILQTSTSEVYGNPSVSPQKESYWGNVNPVGIRSCYDEGKRCAETLMFDYKRQYGADIRVARIFNTYGPKMAVNDGRVVSNFIIQALKGDPVTVYGTGEQTRSLCFVSDTVNALVKLMNTENFEGPVNIGNPCEMTVKEIAEYIIKLTDSKSEIVYMPLPQDDPVRRKPDISLAREKLCWQPEVSLESGLKQTIEYFDKVLKSSGKA